MLSIKRCTIKGDSKEECNRFCYPTIINIYPMNSTYDLVTAEVNQEIYEDVLSFKEVVEIDKDIINYSFTDYKIALKKKHLVSIVMKFFELSGTQDITYINTYNYDISINKRLSLRDIFKPDINFLDLISIEVQNKVNKIIQKFKSIYTELSFENLDNFIQIYEDQSFYIQSDKIVLCFSSYELGSKFPKPIEVEILFEDYKEFLSDYVLYEIWRED